MTIKVKTVITPKILTFFVTNRCNAKCNHCFNWQTPVQNELSFEEIQKIDFSIFNSISITGGEPAMRVDLADICQQIASATKNKIIYLNTNGLMPQRIQEVIKKVGANRVNITVSLDGIESIHNKIRGVDCFDSAVETIKLCKKESANVTILATISRSNMSNILQLIEFLKTASLFAKKGDVVFNITRGRQYAFNIDPSQSAPHNPQDTNTLLTLDELKNVYNQIKPYMINQNRVVWEYSIKMLSQHKKLVTCKAGNIDMVLHANGDIAACEYTSPFTNIHNYNFNLLAAWNSETANAVRNKLSKCYCIHPCNLNTAIPRTLTGVLKLAPDIAKNKTRQLKNKL